MKNFLKAKEVPGAFYGRVEVIVKGGGNKEAKYCDDQECYCKFSPSRPDFPHMFKKNDGDENGKSGDVVDIDQLKVFFFP